MFRDLPQYELRSDRDIPWMPPLPRHWSIERGKALFRRVQREPNASDGVVTCFRDGVVTLRSRRRTTGFTESLKEIGYQGIRRGDLVIHAMDAFAGAVGVSDSDGKGTPVYSVCVPRGKANPYYFAGVVREMARTSWIHSLAKGVRERSTDFRFDAFAVQQLPVPPVEEQAAIVKYLAHANAGIDNAIAAKRRLITLLEEQMRVETSAVMSQAVSDGSKTLPLKRVIDLRGGMTPSKENLSYWGGDVPWISPKDVKSATLLGSIDRITEAALEQTSISMVSAGSVVIVVRGMILARTVPVAVLGVDATLNQDMKALVPKAGVLEPRYLRDWLKSNEDMLVQLVETAGHGTKKLDTDSLMNVRVAVPSVEVQREVCTRVDRANQATRRTIERIEQEIVLLQEFRTRLVADVVTGQVDVRAVAETLPDPTMPDVSLDEDGTSLEDLLGHEDD